MNTKIRVDPSRSRMNQSRPMYGVLSAKSLTGTLWPPSASDKPIRTNAASDRERARQHQRPEQQQAHEVDVVRLPQLGRRQVLGEVEGEYAEEAERRQHQG